MNFLLVTLFQRLVSKGAKPKVNNLLFFFFSQYQVIFSRHRKHTKSTERGISLFSSYAEVSMQIPGKLTAKEFVFKKLGVSSLSDVLVEYTQPEVF